MSTGADGEVRIGLDATAYQAGAQQILASTKQIEDGQRRVDAALKDVGRTAGRQGSFGNAMLQASNIVQDFSAAGLRGVVNNAAIFVQSLGLGAGAAGAAQILTVALAVAQPHLERLIEALGSREPDRFGVSLETLSRRAEALAAREFKLEIDATAVDEAIAKLTRAEEALKAAEAVSRKQTVEQVESGRRVESAIANLAESGDLTGGENLIASVRDVLLERGKDSDDYRAAREAVAEAEAEYERAKQMHGPERQGAEATAVAHLRTRRARVQAIEDQATEVAERTVGGASRGQEDRLRALMGLLERAPRFFEGRGVEVDRLVPALEAATPGNIADEKAAEAAARAREKINRALTAEERRRGLDAGDDPGAFNRDIQEAFADPEAARQAFQDPAFARDVGGRVGRLGPSGGAPAGNGPDPDMQAQNRILEEIRDAVRQGNGQAPGPAPVGGGAARPIQGVQRPPAAGVNR